MNKADQASLHAALRARFENNRSRHPDIEWDEVAARLAAHPGQLRSLAEMEATGGEPDVIGRDAATGELLFCDCAAESPAGRRSLCYDRAGLESRKENRPESSAQDVAAAMGVQLLTEEQYFALQQLGTFDVKTSSWLQTRDAIRQRGGAIFGDSRYGRTFIYHNGAQSYYAARGFRGLLRI